MYNQIDSNKRKTALLILIFVGFIISIGWFIRNFFGYDYDIIIFAVILSFAMALISYFSGDKIVLSSTGAKEIKKENNENIFQLVENLCITAGIPMPKVYIIYSPALNAFATGRNPQKSSIALTTGIIKELEKSELEGVIAHELSHIKNYDILIMTISATLIGSITLISRFFMRSQLYGFRGKGKSTNNKNGKAGIIILIAGMIGIILSPVIAKIISLSISKKREYLADASGALLTRYPEGLARALEKISRSRIPLPNASKETAHLFISNPLKGFGATNFFSTHPPIEDRINKLRTMA